MSEHMAGGPNGLSCLCVFLCACGGDPEAAGRRRCLRAESKSLGFVGRSNVRLAFRSVSLDRPYSYDTPITIRAYPDPVHMQKPSPPKAQLWGELVHWTQGEPCKACHVGRPIALKIEDDALARQLKSFWDLPVGVVWNMLSTETRASRTGLRGAGKGTRSRMI